MKSVELRRSAAWRRKVQGVFFDKTAADHPLPSESCHQLLMGFFTGLSRKPDDVGAMMRELSN